MIPLILSWAVTIHKMQGVTLEKAVVELDCFGHAMEYVALSRVKSLEGLAISSINFKRFESNKFTNTDALNEIKRQLNKNCAENKTDKSQQAQDMLNNEASKAKIKDLIAKIKAAKTAKSKSKINTPNKPKIEKKSLKK